MAIVTRFSLQIDNSDRHTPDCQVIVAYILKRPMDSDVKIPVLGWELWVNGK